MSEEPVKVKKAPKLNALVAEKDAPRNYVEPDEWYNAELENAETNMGKFGPYIKFTFRLLDGDLENGESAKNTKVTALMDASLSPTKKLWQWVKVFINKEPDIGQSYDLTSYYGERFRVLIKDKVPKKGENTDKRFQQVDTVKRRKEELKKKSKE